MKIEISSNTTGNLITSYNQEGIIVNGRMIRETFIISADNLIVPALTNSFDLLTSDHIIQLCEMKPEVLIFGSGQQQQFLPAEFITLLYRNQIGFEVMTTPAACRSYSILYAEDRKVVAAMFQDS